MARANDGDGDRAGRAGTPTVLYVDPDDETAGPAAAAIERAGVRVERVRDVDGALERLEGVDCVVSRHRLPGESGLSLLKTVRERDSDRELPFVLFTDDGDENLAGEAITASVSEYVPSRSGEALHRSLIECVERALDGGGTAGRDVDETLKDRAMDEAPIGITIADATVPDVPMVYLNDSFEELTGYDRADVLDRNCRFLQGSRSDPEAVDRLREAIDGGEEASVELVNYTADGEAFWNRVDIAPIYDDGELTHFVGFQTDVTERVEAERTAREEAARARRERETVESLLDHLNGVVADVTGALVEARGRSAAASSVCERLVDSDQYAFACVADIDPGSEAAWVDVSAGPADALTAEEFPLDDGGPVARAVERGESVFEDAPGGTRTENRDDDGDDGGDGNGWPMFAPPFADRPLGAIPLRYGEATYGVLVVVADDDAGFDEHERGVLGAIGHVTATAINALTTQRRLNSDEVVELEFSLTGPDPFVVALSGELDCAFEHVGTVTDGEDGEGGTAMFFEVTGAAVEDVRAALDALGEGITCTPLTDGERRTVLEFGVGRSPLVATLREHGGRLQSLSAEGGTGQLVVDIDREAEPRRVVEAVERELVGASLSAYRDRERPARTRGDVLEEIDERLTDRQATALKKAYVGGFFEWPRDTTGEELAESMGIDRSTFHQHFRVAQRKVLDTLYDP